MTETSATILMNLEDNMPSEVSHKRIKTVLFVFHFYMRH